MDQNYDDVAVERSVPVVSKTREELFAEAFARVGGKYKAAHDTVGHITVHGGKAFFRRPSEREYLIWSTATDVSLKATAMQQICRACFLGMLTDEGESKEDIATYDAIIQREGPAFTNEKLPYTVGDLIMRLSGVRVRELGFL